MRPRSNARPRRSRRGIPSTSRCDAAVPSPHSFSEWGEGWGEGQTLAPAFVAAPHPDPLPLKNGERESLIALAAGRPNVLGAGGAIGVGGRPWLRCGLAGDRLGALDDAGGVARRDAAFARGWRSGAAGIR